MVDLILGLTSGLAGVYYLWVAGNTSNEKDIPNTIYFCTTAIFFFMVSLSSMEGYDSAKERKILTEIKQQLEKK